jgi:hypothetical protein
MEQLLANPVYAWILGMAASMVAGWLLRTTWRAIFHTEDERVVEERHKKAEAKENKRKAEAALPFQKGGYVRLNPFILDEPECAKGVLPLSRNKSGGMGVSIKNSLPYAPSLSNGYIEFVNTSSVDDGAIHGARYKKGSNSCSDCCYLHSKEDGPRTGQWYNQFCLHPSEGRETIWSPEHNRTEYLANDGKRHSTAEPCARDINPRNQCSMHLPK